MTRRRISSVIWRSIYGTWAWASAKINRPQALRDLAQSVAKDVGLIGVIVGFDVADVAMNVRDIIRRLLPHLRAGIGRVKPLLARLIQTAQIIIPIAKV